MATRECQGTWHTTGGPLHTSTPTSKAIQGKAQGRARKSRQLKVHLLLGPVERGLLDNCCMNQMMMKQPDIALTSEVQVFPSITV